MTFIETGFLQLPVRLHKGPNVFLFQAGRDRLKARLTVPKGAAFFNSADLTMPGFDRGRIHAGRGGHRRRERHGDVAR